MFENKIVLYHSDGHVEKTYDLNKEELDGVAGMLSKCHMKDGSEKVGYINYYHGVSDYIVMWTWNNLDEETQTFTDDDPQAEEEVLIEDIITIESIMYSHPRWGAKLTNTFFIGGISPSPEEAKILLKQKEKQRQYLIELIDGDKTRDINILIDDVILNCRAVGIIKHKNKILFQKRKKDEYWALPGGKIKVREQSSKTLKRELEEEIDSTIKVKDLFSVSEHFFDYGDDKYHQYIFAYNVDLVSNKALYDQLEFDGTKKEKEIIYKWFDINELKNLPIKPDFLKHQLTDLSKEIKFNFYKEIK